MKKMNKRGFTIVELSIVIAVIAILSAVLIPTFTSIVENSKNSAAIQEAKNAYTQYVAELDYDTEVPEEYLIYKTDDNKYVAFDNGNLVLDTDDVPFESEADAIEALGFVDNADTTDVVEGGESEQIQNSKFYKITATSAPAANNP